MVNSFGRKRFRNGESVEAERDRGNQRKIKRKKERLDAGVHRYPYACMSYATTTRATGARATKEHRDGNEKDRKRNVLLLQGNLRRSAAFIVDRARVPQVTGRSRIPQIFTARVTHAPANTTAARSTHNQSLYGEDERARARSITLHRKNVRVLRRRQKTESEKDMPLYCIVILSATFAAASGASRERLRAFNTRVCA